MIYTIQICDEWKSYNSMILKGVYTTKKELIKGLRRLEKENEIVMDELLKLTNIELEAMSIRTLNDYCKYKFIQEVEKNKEM